MVTLEEVVRKSLWRDGPGFAVMLDPILQGFPGAAHGGSVLALFDAAAGRVGTRRLAGRYDKRVPLDVPLRLRVTPDTDGAVCRLVDGEGAPLVEGGVHGLSPASTSPVAVAPRLRGTSDQPLPVSRGCLVCGVDNALGLRARVVFDDEQVWAAWRPREGLHTGAGRLAPLALTALLDEVAFWLGALATGESGMTTELSITLHRDVAPAGTLVVTGDRRRVTPRPHDPRYLETAVAAIDGDGDVIATATITFVVIRGAARRLAAALQESNPPAVVRRVFPRYGSA
jgi:acyl-coenzyme A thioesterase PaaI-like protein